MCDEAAAVCVCIAQCSVWPGLADAGDMHHDFGEGALNGLMIGCP